MDIVAAIDHWGRTTPDQIAHRSAGRGLTYGELFDGSNRLATSLLETLPNDDRPVLVRGHKEPEMLIAFLGVLKSGRAYIPLDVSLPEARVRQIAEATSGATPLTPEEVRTRIARTEPRDHFPSRSPDAPHYVMFTSGSTGEPKGVVITSENLSTFLAWMLAEQGFAAPEVFLNQAPFSFDLSVMDLYLSLVTGGTLFSVTKDDTANLRRLSATLQSSQTTTWVSTPSFARLCLADASFNESLLPQVRRFLFCGETLSPFVAAELLRRFPAAAVWNTYGPTEATVAMTSIRIDSEILERHGALPVGFPMSGGKAEIRDDRGLPLPAGQPGEIVIHGRNVSPGYLGRPDLTARVFGETGGVRTYRTGDWGSLDADGRLFVTGRMDAQIKLNGYRIELGDIEANLRKLATVGDAVVHRVAGNGRPDILAAFVVPTARDGQSDLDLMISVRTALAEHLPGYMIPTKYRFLESFPMTPNGKADLRKLAELL